MLVLLQTIDPKKPQGPRRDRLVNERHVVEVEPVYSDETVDGEKILAPIGSDIKLTDKRVLRVPYTPRVVHRAFRTGAVEGL